MKRKIAGESGRARGPASESSGSLIAGRYEIVAPVGRGATADVFHARDAVNGTEVAVKVFRAGRVLASPRLRREVAVLRMLRLPGVVELLDEGTHRGRPYLVMTFVRGRAFPGTALPVSWQAIAEQATAVLDTLSRVHGAGIVHRDIKPANMLVDEQGSVKLLDFGIAWSAALAGGLTEDERFLGTPAYLAPEQLRGLAPDPRTDLYALGVTLFEALSGRLPHDTGAPGAFFAARPGGSPPSLRSLAPGVPARVAAVIERMLAVDPGERPQSAAEVLNALGDGSGMRSRSTLPWLGSRAIVDAIAGAGRCGSSFRVLGESGLGKTRALGEASEILCAEGRRLVYLVPATYPFESLEPLTGQLGPTWDDKGLREVSREARTLVESELRSGTIVVADDEDQLDPLTRKLLDECDDLGSILRGCTPLPAPPAGAHATLHPLEASALQALFTGHERVFHIREDAATLLHERTEGIPRNIDTGLSALWRQNILHPDGSLWSVTRSAIERLREVAHADLLLSGMPTSLERPPAAWHDLLAYVAFLSPHATVAALSHATGAPRFHIEAGLAELERRGFLFVREDGRCSPRWARFSLPDWPAAKTAEAHRRAAEALPGGAPRRLFHLVSTSVEGGLAAEDAILQETHARAARLASEGRVSTALALLHDGVGAALELAGSREIRGGSPFHSAFSLWTELALAEQAIFELDRLLCELLRIKRRSAALRAIESLVKAAVAFRQGAADGLALAESVPPFREVQLERQRQAIRVLAARRHDLETEERVVAEAVAWAEDSRHPEARAAGLGFRGRLCYRLGRYAEAGEYHEAAAALERLPSLRIAARLNAASALMEGFRHGDAERLAASAAVEAAACRSPFFEARAEWLRRTARFRTGHPLLPDEELTEATAELNVPDQLTVTCLSEAAIAWHAGLHEVAARLARRTREVWERFDNRPGAQLVECLEIGSGVAVSEERALELAREVEGSPVPHVAIQAMALLSIRLPGDERLKMGVRRAWAATEENLRASRADILSADEALALVEGQFQRTSST